MGDRPPGRAPGLLNRHHVPYDRYTPTALAGELRRQYTEAGVPEPLIRAWFLAWLDCDFEYHGIVARADEAAPASSPGRRRP